MKTLHIFSREVLAKLPVPVSDVLKRLEVQAGLVALFSGTCFGLTCQIVGIPFLAGMLPVSVIVYFIFEMGVLSPTKTASKAQNILRIVFGIILAVINSLGIETVVFNDSTENSFSELKAAEIEQIDSLYQLQKVPYLQQITAIDVENDSIDALMQQWSERIFQEVDKGGNNRPRGKGSYANYYIQMAKRDSVRFATLLAENAIRIARLNQQIDQLEAERLDKQNIMPDPSERGILERIKMLHGIVLQKDNYPMQVFFVCCFLAALCVELSTIYVKWKHSDAFDAYLAEQDRQEEERIWENDMETKYRRERTHEKLKREEAKRDLEDKLRHEEEMAEKRLKHKWNLKEMVMRWLRRDSQDEDKLTDSELKKLRRKSIKSHLNGNSENHIESSEE